MALRIAMLSRDVMNECAQVWTTIAFQIFFVGLNIADALADSDEQPPTEERDFTVHQNLHPSGLIHILEQR